jgi:hypothetical protein
MLILHSVDEKNLNELKPNIKVITEVSCWHRVFQVRKLEFTANDYIINHYWQSDSSIAFYIYWQSESTEMDCNSKCLKLLKLDTVTVLHSYTLMIYPSLNSSDQGLLPIRGDEVDCLNFGPGRSFSL